ncbi:CHAT domain-containing protein, partial [Spirulina sp. CS-785/01]|uniref:CHAT domain-containing protein n=1 Tax=Spirulina sp. CS-785/01 TaxID=3021716 RepID=UPI0023315961
TPPTPSSNPSRNLAALIGDLINAETVIESPTPEQYTLNWQIADTPLLLTELTLPSPTSATLLTTDFPSPTPLTSQTTTSTPTSTPTPTPLTSPSTLHTLTGDNLVTAIDRYFTAQYENYLGENTTDTEVTAYSIREMLKNIEAQTGQRSVILYALRHPQGLQLVLVLPQGSPLSQTVPISSGQLGQTLRELRKNITNPRRGRQFLGAAQQLYQWLIAPYKAELEGLEVDTLIFSLDVGLRSLPLAALHDGEQFLIEQYSLGQIPSVSLTDSRYRSLNQAPVLAMGASEFPEYEPLPAVPLELELITESTGKSFLNQQFTLANLYQQAQNPAYEIVHLATHSNFQGGDSHNSYIHLWEERLPIDGLRELQWGKTRELLVLSSCRTALGDIQAELGFAGLAVNTGVKSALASLWNVHDWGTLALMSEFYHHLQDPAVTTKAEALRRAQVALLRQSELTAMALPKGNNNHSASLLSQVQGRDFSHPYYWSSFLLIGSPW